MRLSPVAAGFVFVAALLWPPLLGIVLLLWAAVYVAQSLVESYLERRDARHQDR
jgi:hypothetical protein